MRISQTKVRKIARNSIKKILLLAVSLILVSCSTPEKTPEGTITRVERVVSGNTLEVIDSRSVVPVLQKVRLLGISAPDLKQNPWGIQAKGYLEQLSLGKEVLIESDVEQSDRYNRVLAYVWLDGVLLNEQLVKSGYVLADELVPNSKYSQRLQYAQYEARILGLGIWNPQQPMRLTPAEFRRQNEQA